MSQRIFFDRCRLALFDSDFFVSCTCLHAGFLIMFECSLPKTSQATKVFGVKHSRMFPVHARVWCKLFSSCKVGTGTVCALSFFFLFLVGSDWPWLWDGHGFWDCSASACFFFLLTLLCLPSLHIAESVSSVLLDFLVSVLSLPLLRLFLLPVMRAPF